MRNKYIYSPRSHGEFENKIISMYAKGISTWNIQSHIEHLYGLKLSSTAVSNITDFVIPTIREWQNRSLESVYPIVLMDAIHYKVKEDRPVYRARPPIRVLPLI